MNSRTTLRFDYVALVAIAVCVTMLYGIVLGERLARVPTPAVIGAPAAAPEAELAALIRAANGRIHEMAADDEERSGMGTTVTAAAVSGDSVGIAHVGDSRAYRWRGGELEQLTEDHSLVGEMLRQGKISASEAETHPQRSIITRALGIEPEVEIDTSSVDWEPGDIFLLCSDGLTSMVPDQEIAAIIGGKESLEQAAAGLVDAANTHGGRDNITVILFSPGEDETTVLSSVPEEHHHTGSGGFRSRLEDRKSTRLNSSHTDISRMPSSA